MKRLLLAALLALPLPALADTVSLSWTNPSTNTDGSAIPASGAGSLVSNKVYRGTCSAPGVFGTQQAVYASASAVSVYVTPDLAPGTYCFRVTATNTYGIESAVSLTVQKIVPAPIPNPPTGLVVNASLQAIRLSPTGVYWIAQPNVGTIAKGSPCYGPGLLKKPNGSYKAVNTAQAVNLKPVAAGDTVAAICS